MNELTRQGICFPCFTGDRLKDFFYGDKPKPEPYLPVDSRPDSPSPRNSHKPPAQRTKPPVRPVGFIRDVAAVPERAIQHVVMSHPETVQVPPTQDTRSVHKQPENTPEKPMPEVRTSQPVSTTDPKPVQKATSQGEKDTKPVQKATDKGKIKKLEEYDGKLGRKHKEHEIEYILDTYLQTGLLPTYVTQKMRWNYKHHRRLPERRERLEQAGKRVVVPETPGTTGNITPLRRTDVHSQRVSS